jgi:hypothetical protein
MREATRILEAMHIEEPELTDRLYHQLDSYPLLRELLDIVIVPNLNERLLFGDPGDGQLLAEQKSPASAGLCHPIIFLSAYINR